MTEAGALARDYGPQFSCHNHNFEFENKQPWLSHPDDPEAEFKTAKAGIQYLESVRW
jgi:hypothetical protein